MALIRAFFCAVILALFTINTPAVAEPAVGDMALGDSGAPVTVIEYASMTCPHCAAFHQENYKKTCGVKRNLIQSATKNNTITKIL